MTKKINFQKLIMWLVYAAALVLMSCLFAMQRINTCDYNSINGDFQSYNVFRRILNGQAPYADFSNYIGMAPIIINLPFLLFSGTFASSLFITTFTTNIVFCLCVFIIFYLITENALLSGCVSVLLPKLIASQILNVILGPKFGYIFTQRFEGLYSPSNSMRGVRAFLPFLIVGIAVIICRVIKSRTGKSIDIASCLKNLYVIGVLGLIQGIFIVWSNDYGIACIGASLVILIALQIFLHKMPILKFLKNIGVFAAACITGLLLSAFIITGGSPMAWFSATSQTAEFQLFYFNGTQGKAVLPYLFTCAEFWVYTGILCLFLLFCLYLLIKGKATNNILLLVFVWLCIIAATLIYICGGSGYNCREALEVYTILSVIAVLARVFLKLVKKYASAVNIIFAAVICLACSYYIFLFAKFTPAHSGSYISALGGYSTFNKALIEADTLTENQQVFSMYSTGLEVVKNQFQPTGYDYIIHALGTETQQNYEQNFINGNYKYVQTPSMEVGIWLANQNWYLYRHLLQNYQRVYKTEYSWIWEKQDIKQIENDVTVTINQLDKYTVEIICNSNNKDLFVADVQITHKTSFDDPLTAIGSLGRKFVQATTTSCADSDAYKNISLPDNGQGSIPVLIINGQGKATVKASLGGNISIKITNAKVNTCVPPYLHND